MCVCVCVCVCVCERCGFLVSRGMVTSGGGVFHKTQLVHIPEVSENYQVLAVVMVTV